ncbi:MAG: glycerol-3-phosphate 1-O-acyltransferase PlsY [Thermoanaerobaculum sp.]|nr:glycerol-3-phosphate 1-O-acyltransferase PlsY [Thermoanaerobaculum sp.]MDW7968570.1 glycerol-3-phosphate 1-O-acyltransferase PlsY [Thermoanaerobaculum sp.]
MRFVLVAAAYLLGSIPFAFVLVRLRTGLDLRHQGSGTVGATNTGRVLGLGWALVVMVLDVGKGLVAVWLATQLSANPAWHTAAALAAVAGHCWPVWLSFHGGKGLATSAGALLVLSPETLALVGVLWLVIFACLRRVVVASSVATALMPVAFGWLEQPSLGSALPVVAWSLVVLAKHLSDLRRLVQGAPAGGGGTE